MPQKEHQFGDGRLYRAVVSTDDSGLQEVDACFVASHFDRTGQALADVDNDKTAVCSLLQFLYQPLLLKIILNLFIVSIVFSFLAESTDYISSSTVFFFLAFGIALSFLGGFLF